MTPTWLGLAALVGTQIAYPLMGGEARAWLVVVSVGLGFVLSVAHAAATRGLRTAAGLVAVTTGGGLAVEALGVATGFPFGAYAYTGALGPVVLHVPVVVPLAWTWMAWPSWLAAGRLTRGRLTEGRLTGGRLTGGRLRRVGLAALALAGWDLFLDPQMVAAGFWRWSAVGLHLPGEPNVPAGNYLGWLAVSVILMVGLATTARPRVRGGDGPMLALYLWTYYSSVLAHAVFLGLPASAGWGALGMGLVAVPLTVRLLAPLWTVVLAPR